MELEQLTCPDCGAPVMRVQIRDTPRTITLDAEPSPGGVWGVFIDRDTGEADAVYRARMQGRPLHRGHDYTCTATFQLRPMGAP